MYVVGAPGGCEGGADGGCEGGASGGCEGGADGGGEMGGCGGLNGGGMITTGSVKSSALLGTLMASAQSALNDALLSAATISSTRSSTAPEAVDSSWNTVTLTTVELASSSDSIITAADSLMLCR